MSPSRPESVLCSSCRCLECCPGVGIGPVIIPILPTLTMEVSKRQNQGLPVHPECRQVTATVCPDTTGIGEPGLLPSACGKQVFFWKLV